MSRLLDVDDLPLLISWPSIISKTKATTISPFVLRNSLSFINPNNHISSP
jgi:hypothetical protein